jgi:ABC-type uncharacterized transport system involved in gliding motility auxiliary subunit
VKIINIRQTFNDPKLRHRGYATLVLVVVLAILIIANLLVEKIPLKLDLSENQLFTLSQDTYKVLDGLKQPVTIYLLCSAGKENTEITDILKKYCDRTEKVSLKYIDPNKNPGFVGQYIKDLTNISDGSLIITSGKKYKYFSYNDLFQYDNSNPYQQQVTSLALEQRVTGALMYVNSASNPILYTLQGHKEYPLPEAVTKQLELQNYTLKELTLFTNSMPSDAGLLMVISPKQDLTTPETDKIRQYLAGNGRAIFLLDPGNSDMPNFQSLLASYGVSLQNVQVIETDSSLYNGNYPNDLLPNLLNHPITEPIKSEKIPVLIRNAQGIKILDVRKRTTTIEPLMSTSDKAWGKTNYLTDRSDKYLIKRAADLSGPFNLAVAITDKSPNSDQDTKIVLVSNSWFIVDPKLVFQLPSNVNFLTNSINWLQDHKEGLSIQPKSLRVTRLNFTTLQLNIFSGITIILIPLLILGAGLTVWLRRRNL